MAREKYDPSKPFPRLTAEQGYALCLEAMYWNMTIEDLVEHLNCNKSDARCLVGRFNIPISREDKKKFFDPRWVVLLPIKAKDPVLGAMTQNPSYHGDEPLYNLHAAYSRREDKRTELIPVALMAVAQYRLGALPPVEPNCVRFRDGDPYNLRPENVVYTGSYRPSLEDLRRAPYNSLPLQHYTAKCSRCGYRTTESTSPEGWSKEKFVEYEYASRTSNSTRIGEGLLCPICQEFTETPWNGSRG